MISLRDVITGFGNRDPLAEVWRRDLRGGGGGAAEITGVPPLRYIGDGRPLTDYRISGNTVQDGTPSPDAPVDAVGCGVRTGNLFDAEFVQGGVLTDGSITNATTRARAKVFIRPGETYSFACSAPTRIVYAFRNDDTPIRTVFDDPRGTDAAIFTTPEGTSYIWVCVMNEGGTGTILPSSVKAPILNLGSAPLPYEPYGYKLPLTVNGVEYPIYLGQVETTRKVKKMVLTGEETSWYTSNGFIFNDVIRPDYLRSAAKTISCSHYKAIGGVGSGADVSNGQCALYRFALGQRLYVRDNSFATVEEWKAYLAAQYAAGTPVTVWYVLAEPETAVVNEPLMKIGDYADTVSFAQAGVTIPTVNGANVLDVPTEVKPSEVTIKGGISSV